MSDLLTQAHDIHTRYSLYVLALAFTVLGLAIETTPLGGWSVTCLPELIAWAALLASGIAGILNIDRAVKLSFLEAETDLDKKQTNAITKELGYLEGMKAGSAGASAAADASEAETLASLARDLGIDLPNGASLKDVMLKEYRRIADRLEKRFKDAEKQVDIYNRFDKAQTWTLIGGLAVLAFARAYSHLSQPVVTAITRP